MTEAIAPAPKQRNPKGIRKRHQLLIAAQLTLSVVMVYFAVRGLNWQSLAQMAGRLSLWFVIGASAISMFTTVICSVRWREVLVAMGHRSPLAPLVFQNFVGTFFNNFSPSMLGQDAAKTYYLGRDLGYVTAGISVLVDKILGLASLTVVGVLLIPLLGLTGPLFTGAFTFALLFSLVAATVLASMRMPLEKLLPPCLARWSLGQRLLAFASGGRIIAGSAVTPRTLAAGLLATLLNMGLTSVSYFWFLTEATGASPSLLHLTCALCLVQTVSNLPVSVNGIGVREQAHVILLVALGVPMEAALGLSFLQYVFLLLQSLLGWVLWVARPSGKI